MTTQSTLIPLPAPIARLATGAGAVIALAGTFLAWTWTTDFPGDLTVTGYPGGLQILTLTGAALTLLFVLSGYDIRGLRWLTPGGTNSPVRLLALGTLGTTGYTMGAIAYELGGIVNLEPGAWVSGIGALIATVAALALPSDEPLSPREPQPGAWQRFRNSLAAPAATRAKTLPAWAEILIITAAFGTMLYVFTYGIGIPTEDSEQFIGFLITAAFAFTAITRAGLISRITALTTKHRNVALTAALVAALCFPFTQDTAEYTLIGANILIFATVALGLNVVVGLAGLLDLGYVAFLGVGAYTAALVSGAPSPPSASTSPSGPPSSPEPQSHSSSASSSAPRPSDCAATTSPSSPSASVKSSASPSTTSTATADPTSPTAPKASPASRTSTSSGSTSDSATTSARSRSAGPPTTTC